MAPEHEPQIGELIDARYRITGHLGSGGMGSVYRGEHVTIRRPVAIKVLHAQFVGDGNFAARFEREAFAAGRVQHPNCVTVSDFGRFEEQGLYLVMELVDGIILGDLLDEEAQLDPRRALRIVRHVLRGLGHAHRAGVVHRDVKPDNVIVVEQDGDPDFAKVLDFGIAKLIDEASGVADKNLTRIGTALGTPNYISPEQALADQVDARADLYSTTAMLFEMLAGHTPFRAEQTLDVLRMHVSAPIPRLADTVPELAEVSGLQELIDTGMAKEREQRYQDADSYVAAIEQVLAGMDRPVEVADAGTGATASLEATEPDQPSRRDVRQRPLGPGSARAETAAPVVRSGTSLPFDLISTPLWARTTRSRRLWAAVGAAVLLLIVVIALVGRGGGGASGERGDSGAPGAARAPTTAPSSAGATDPARSDAPAVEPDRPPRRGAHQHPLGSRAAPASARPDATAAPPSSGPSAIGADPAREAAAMLARGAVAEAIAYLEERAPAIAGDAGAQLQLGHAYCASHRSADCVAAYRRALKIQPAQLGDAVVGANLKALALSGTADEAAMAWQLGALDLRIAAVIETIVPAAVHPRDPAKRHRARQVAERAGVIDRVDLVGSYALDLHQLKNCDDRRAVIARLRALGDKRAVDPLERALRRKAGGVLGIGAKNVNRCLQAEARAAIEHLQSL